MKKKLIASIFSLVMAFVLMTSASFAWFTVSTEADVKDLTMTMATDTPNLEIARDQTGSAPSEVTANDSGNDYTWGATVTSFETDGATVTGPCGLSGTSLATMTYGTDGRASGLGGTVSMPDSFTNGVGLAKGSYGDVELNVAGVYKVWLRSNSMSTATASLDGTPTSTADCHIAVGSDLNTLTDITDGSTATVNVTADGVECYIVVYFDGEGIYAADMSGGSFEASGINVHFE